MPKKLKKDYVIEFLNQNPLITNMSAAKTLCKKYPDIFKNLDSTRTVVRLARGVAGPKKGLADPILADIWALREQDIVDSFPASMYVKKTPFHFPKHLKKCLLLGDIHLPYHDDDAVLTAIKYGVEQEVDSVFLNGDILDCLQLSFHERNPRSASFKMELEFAKEFFYTLRIAFPNQEIYFIPGNHENRIKRYLWQKGKEIHDLDEIRLEKLLHLDAFDIKYLEHKSKVYWGKTLIEHGDKMLGGGGVNPARTTMLKFKRSTVVNHFHKTQTVSSKIYDGELITSNTIGCLCGLEADYMEVNEWNHGFGILHKDDSLDWVENKRIENKRVF